MNLQCMTMQTLSAVLADIRGNPEFAAQHVWVNQQVIWKSK